MQSRCLPLTQSSLVSAEKKEEQEEENTNQQVDASMSDADEDNKGQSRLADALGWRIHSLHSAPLGVSAAEEEVTMSDVDEQEDLAEDGMEEGAHQIDEEGMEALVEDVWKGENFGQAKRRATRHSPVPTAAVPEDEAMESADNAGDCESLKQRPPLVISADFSACVVPLL